MLLPSILTGLLAIANAETMLNTFKPAATNNSTLVQPHIIPVKEVGCFNVPLNVPEVNTAKIRFLEWGSMHRIPPASYRGQVSGDMAVWICNCKRFTKDHVVGAELNEAQQLIGLHCGANTTGWVWSSKWLKSINIGPRTIFVHRKGDRIGGRPGKIPLKCPHFCVLSGDRSDDDKPGPPNNDDPKYDDPNDGGDNDPEDGGGNEASDDNDPDGGNDDDDSGDNQDKQRTA
ncbi:hypothetical protein F4680DRAFT_450772 [Xylaria scruposa]|nr:hypothetical protein F4680DRAFT_450772 [Xylaria scruposa]